MHAYYAAQDTDGNYSLTRDTSQKQTSAREFGRTIDFILEWKLPKEEILREISK